MAIPKSDSSGIISGCSKVPGEKIREREVVPFENFVTEVGVDEIFYHKRSVSAVFECIEVQ